MVTHAVYAKTIFRPQDNLIYNSRFLPVTSLNIEQNFTGNEILCVFGILNCVKIHCLSGTLLSTQVSGRRMSGNLEIHNVFLFVFPIPHDVQDMERI